MVGSVVLPVGFCGARSLSPSFAPLVSSVVGSVMALGAPVVVGCASGADAFVRSACPAAQVFTVGPAAWGPGAFAARSAALVRSVAADRGSLVGFVASPCPVGCAPARSWQGHGSGSWGALALAVGLGCPVVVFWCGAGAPVLPAWAGRHWVSAPWPGVVAALAWSSVAAVVQSSLF